ncbi:MAG: hypothetical protein IT273_01230 [Chitinophagales bacterium]|nr:hypothetical protein [Chitinophagales bacterium]
MEHGFITTRDLETKYGYSHPPRAARDVREAGIPLETFNVKSEEGKSIAAYKFGDLTQIPLHDIGYLSHFLIPCQGSKLLLIKTARLNVIVQSGGLS